MPGLWNTGMPAPIPSREYGEPSFAKSKKDSAGTKRPFNPLRKIFFHTVDEFEVDHVDGDTMYFHKDGKLCKRKLHKSTVWHRGKKAEFITVGGIRYFAV